MKSIISRIFIFVFLSLSCYFLYLTFISFRYQLIIREQLSSNNLSLTNEELSSIPNIPNVNITTLPLSALKSAYYVQSDRDKFFKLLKKGSEANPYIFFSEYVLANYHFRTKNYDSAYFYANKAFYNWPKNLDHYKLYNLSLVALKDTLEILKAYDFINKSFLEKKAYAKVFIDAYSDAKLRYLIYDYPDERRVSKNEILGEWIQAYDFEGNKIKYLDQKIFFDQNYFKNSGNTYLYDIYNDTLFIKFKNNNKIISKTPIFFSDSLQTLILKDINKENNVDDPTLRDKFYKKVH